MKEWYIEMIQRSTKLSEARNYAKAAGVQLDVGEWIRTHYLIEKGA